MTNTAELVLLLAAALGAGWWITRRPRPAPNRRKIAAARTSKNAEMSDGQRDTLSFLWIAMTRVGGQRCRM
jgi:hypothetical protein